MAFEAYLKIKGEKGGFKGESRRKGREDWIPMLRFEWGVESLKDVATGASAGRRRHKPLTLWKELGASTPQIFQALCSNENLSDVKAEFTRTNIQGEEEVYITIELVDAQVTSVNYSTGGAELGGDSNARGNDLFEQETIALTYSEVTITHSIASTSATDEWDTTNKKTSTQKTSG
jgi:type VI secretion system secreted protein Hcp